MRLGKLLRNVASQECWKIAAVKLPDYSLKTILKLEALLRDQTFHHRFVAVEVTKRLARCEGETKRLQRMFEADEAKPVRNVTTCSKRRQGVRRCAEAYIPDHEFALKFALALHQPGLSNVEFQRLRSRAQARVHRLAVLHGVHAVGSVAELDYFVGVWR